MNSFKTVLNTIRRHRKFLVTTHHNPDADAVSSVLGDGDVFKKFRQASPCA